ALTRAYQRSCEAPRPETLNVADIAARIERLSREKQLQQQSIQPLKEAVADAKANFKAIREEDALAAAELPKLETALAAARQALEKTIMQRRTTEETSSKIRDQARVIADAAAKLVEIVAKSPEDSTLEDAAGKTRALA